MAHEIGGDFRHQASLGEPPPHPPADGAAHLPVLGHDGFMPEFDIADISMVMHSGDMEGWLDPVSGRVYAGFDEILDDEWRLFHHQGTPLPPA